MQLDTDVHVFNPYNVPRPKVRAPQHAHAPQNVRYYVPSRGCLGTARIKSLPTKRYLREMSPQSHRRYTPTHSRRDLQRIQSMIDPHCDDTSESRQVFLAAIRHRADLVEVLLGYVRSAPRGPG